MTVKEQIISKAVELLEKAPTGIRFSVLVKQLEAELPGIKPKNIPAILVSLEAYAHQHIYKPAKGLFLHLKYKPQGESAEPSPPPQKPIGKIKEEDFYDAFANWLVEDLEECTKAISLGGHKFKDKWGTPDVIGIRRPRESDIIKLPTEIVSAEVKVDSNGLITAFGQACSYKLFSHKSYIVVPLDSPEEDLARLDALCLIFGIGLILFEPSLVSEPRFQIRVRATRHEPDMFYVNKNLKEIEDELFA
jgi:hypothetical protein